MLSCCLSAARTAAYRSNSWQSTLLATPRFLALLVIFLVGKAGWITLYESMVARRPTIIMDVIPGQEEPNAEFVTSHGVGLVITDPRRVAQQIECFTGDPKTLRPFEQALAKLAISGDAAPKIVDFINQTFLAQKPPK